MRILHIEKFVARHRGGASTYMFDVLERQRQAGHAVEVFGMAHPDNEPSTYGNGFAPRVELSPPPEGLAAKLKTAYRMVWSTPAATALAEVLEDFKPDVVHCHNLYHQLTPSVLLPVAARGIPAVMTVHDFKLVCPTYHLRDNEGTDCSACVGASPLHAIRKRCESGSVAASSVVAIEAIVHRRRDSYAAINRFLCPSRFMMEQLVAGGLPAERLQHLPNAVDVPRNEAAQTPTPVIDNAMPSLTLVFAGQLIERKGLDLLLKAMVGLPTVTLTVCGDGPERVALEALARPLADQVTFTGHVDGDSLVAAFEAADALVLPSRGMENQPLSVLEAFARSLPVIGTDTAPMRELITEGDNGLLFASGDVNELRTAIQRLESNPADRRRMAARARLRAEADHDMNDHLQRLEEIYEEVIR